MIPFMAPMMMGAPAAAPILPTTWNPADKGAGVVLSNGNLTATGPSTTADTTTRATNSKSSGKWFYEAVWANGDNVLIGCSNSVDPNSVYPGQSSNGISLFPGGGRLFANGGNTTGYTTYARGDRIGFAINIDTRKIWFLKNGASISGDPVAGTGGFSIPSGAIFPSVDVNNSDTSVTANFGATAFAYAPPSGFLPWG